MSLCNVHMGLGPVLSATTSPYATYAACCNYVSNQSIFDMHDAEMNETIGLAYDKQFHNSQQHACDFLSS